MAGPRRRQSPNEHGSALAQQRVEQDIGDETTEEGPNTPHSEMSFRARILVFLAFPMLIGSAALGLAYFLALHDKSRSVDFDQDFIFPFLMALVVAVVIAIRTRGFTGPMAPLVQWPKVRRRKKIVHKRVIVDDDGNEISSPERN